MADLISNPLKFILYVLPSSGGADAGRTPEYLGHELRAVFLHVHRARSELYRRSAGVGAAFARVGSRRRLRRDQQRGKRYHHHDQHGRLGKA